MPPKVKPLTFSAPELDSTPGSGGRPDGEDFPALSDGALSGVETEPDPIEDESFASLFDNLEDSRVDVIRISPEEYKGDLVKGYVGKLGPGDTLETLRQRFGGGKFRLNKRSNSTGRIQARATVDVAGAPVVTNTATDPPSLSPENIRPGGIPATPVTVEVAGQKIQLPVGLADQFAMMQAVVLWTKSIQQIFPNPTDINQNLLALLLEKRETATGDPIEMFVKLKTAFPEMFDRSDVGSANWLSVLQEAIKQAGGVLAAMGGQRLPGVRPAVIPAGAPAPSRALPAPSPTIDLEPEIQPAVEAAAEPEVSLTPQPTPFQLGMAMLAEVVKQFRLEPPKEEPRVVALLDQLFQLPADRRQVLLAFKDTGFDWCEGQLEDVFAEDPRQRDEFKRYYENIFTEFTRSDREAKFLA
jgi:hypothetical protein